MDFKELINTLSTLNNELRESSIRAVNTSLTLRNWFFGFYILEFEQNGKDRAGYGQTLLANISQEMKSLAIPGTEERELRRYRQFYQAYQAVGNLVSTNGRIRDSLSPELLPSTEKIVKQAIRETVYPELHIPDSHYLNLLNKVAYNHFVDLIRLDDPLKRLFYELESMRGSWSVRELRRQIGSLLYERTGLLQNKEKLLAMVQASPATSSFTDLIRDPYIFEFLGLKQQEVLPEKKLEQSLLDHLQQFLLELGKASVLKPGKNASSSTMSITL